LLAATIYQENSDMNHKLCYIDQLRNVYTTGAAEMLQHINGNFTT